MGCRLEKVPRRHRCAQCPDPAAATVTHASAGDSWALLGKPGSVSCGVTAPFSWVLVHTGFCLCPPRVYFLVLYKFWQLYGAVNGDLLQEGLCHMQVCYTQSSCPCGSSLLTAPPQEMLKHSSVSFSVASLGPGAHKVCLSLLSISVGNGV